VFIKINGTWQYLWRAVDQDGNVLDILVQPKRDAKAAKRFMAKLMGKQCRVPRVLVTDKPGTRSPECPPRSEHDTATGPTTL
jgi:putative transposase